MTERTLFAEFVAGSHLYGSATEGSDKDLVRLWYPTLEEAVANKAVTIAQSVTPQVDIRGITLGQFVMSLGKNNENTLLAIHYWESFKIPSVAYINKAFVLGLAETGESMMKHAVTSKIYAHGWRYQAAAAELAETGSWQGYPLTGAKLEKYVEIRSTPDGSLTYEPNDALMTLIKESPYLAPTKIDYQYLANWVWEKYTSYFNGVDR